MGELRERLLTLAICVSLAGCGGGSAMPAPAGESIGGSCVWSATVVTDQAAQGRVTTVLGFTNISGHVCPLVEVVSVTGLDPGGVARSARQDGFIPMGRTSLEIRPGARVEMIVTTSGVELCDPIAASVPMSSLTIKLRDGSSTTLALAEPIEGGCIFRFTEFGSWE